MALIGKIRKNSWLLIVLIGLGLGGFIVMDMTSGSQSVFGSGQFEMGEVDGEKLDWNKFNRTESILYSNSGSDVYGRRNALWNYFVEEAIVNKEAEALGLGVSREELLELQFGSTPSPIIVQRFRDPVTQGLNRQLLNDFRTQIESGNLMPEQAAFWAVQEKEIIKDRLQTKIGGLVTKALYTPTWMAEMGYKDQNQRVDLEVVAVPFDEIDNTEVALSDSDFENYLEENRTLFEREEESRLVEYVSFNVKPTAADSAKWEKLIADLIPEFERTSNDSLFIESNLGNYDPSYLPKDRLPAGIADTLFNMPLGAVYGPYIDGRFYRAVKLIDRKVIPDSVRSRHILAPASNAVEAVQAQLRIDSLKNLIETGQESFDSLASKFGTDNTRNTGGDLGYAAPGAMVKPFNDLIFYQAEEGKLYTVITQFGIHLVEVTGKKFLSEDPSVKVGYIQQAIVPSEDTQKDMFTRAQSFYAENRTIDKLEAAVDADPELSLETFEVMDKNAYSVGSLSSGQSSRDMVRWAFLEAGVGDVSPEIYSYQDPIDFYDNRYVIAGLKAVYDPGLPAVDVVREQIEPQVINFKKGELLKERLKGKDLSAIASEYGVEVQSLEGITFSQTSVPNLGAEPKVIGTAFSLSEGSVSEPVAGNNGVYVIRMLSKPEVGTATNIPQLRRTMSTSIRSQVNLGLMQAMRENADIEDNRTRFY